METIKHNSQLLTDDDKQIIVEVVGPSCRILHAVIAQFYVTAPPYHKEWIKQCTGVLCLISDKLKRGYFFKIINLPKNEVFWEHQLYLKMEYVREKLFLHTFEGEQSLVAFNFAVVEEAEELFSSVQRCIERLRLFDLKYKKKLILQQNAKKTTEHIGSPMDFRHVEHVGFDPDTGFDTNALNSKFVKFFEKAGIPSNQLNTKTNHKIVVDLLKEYGEENLLNAITNQPKPPPPPRLTSAGNSSIKANTPTNHSNLSSKAKPMKSINTPTVVVDNWTPATPPLTPPRPVQTPPFPTPPPPPPLATIPSQEATKASGIPQNLLESIRNGKKLNPVSETNDKNSPQDNMQNNAMEVDLAAVLKNALLSRSKVLTNDSSEESNRDDDDDEDWD